MATDLTLHPCDIETLHLILYAGKWALPDFMRDPQALVMPGMQIGDIWIPPELYRPDEHVMLEIARINRLRKTGWVKIAEQHLWLTPAGLEQSPCWLDSSWARIAKREVRTLANLSPLKHRIPWGQIASLWIRGDLIKTPLAKWFDPALQTMP